MAKIIFRQPDGTSKAVEVPVGVTLMEAAVFNNVKGMYASCGGDGGCATCQVYVDDAWSSRLPQKSRKEISTLRFAFGLAPSSRLACQIAVTPDLDGLLVELPERQF